MDEQVKNPEAGIIEESPEERIMGMLDDNMFPVNNPIDDKDIKKGEEVKKSEEDKDLGEPKPPELDPNILVSDEKLEGEEVTLWTIPKGGENGEDIEVPEGELINGYLRQSNFTRKTQAIAEKDKGLDSERNSLMESRQSYIDALGIFQEQASNDLEKFKDVNWAELKEEDTEKYLMMKAEQSEVKERIKLAEDDKTKATQEQSDALMTQYQEIAKHEAEILSSPEGIENWTHVEEGPKIRQSMKDYALSVGYTEDELNILIDHRALIILDKARKFDELQGNSKTLVQKRKAKVVPKVVKPGTAKAADQKRKEKTSKLADRLRGSGSVKDAAAMMFEKLDDDLTLM